VQTYYLLCRWQNNSPF